MTEPFESRLQALAKDFEYPLTPSIKDGVMRRLHKPAARRNRKLAWGLTMLIVVAAGMMSVPNVRAAVLEFIQIGIVRIFPAPVESPTPMREVPVTATPALTQSSLIPFLDSLGGQTNLENARAIVDFPIPLPAHSTDLGEPDRVFIQDANGWMVILVWLEPQDPGRVRMSLHLIEEGSWTIGKYHPEIIQETTLNNQRAIWTVGDYPLILQNAEVQFVRLIEGHVLVWEVNKVTYRLETNLSLEEAIRIAESLQAP